MSSGIDDRGPAVSVLGGGPWAAVLADLLIQGGHPVGLFIEDEDIRARLAKTHRHPAIPGVKISPELELFEDLKAGATAPIVLFGGGPGSLRAMVREVSGVLRGHQVAVTASRGLEVGTGATLMQVIREESCIKKVGALVGPRLTLEIAKGAPGSAVVGSVYKEVTGRVSAMFSSERFRVYGSSDAIGVEIGGALASCLIFLAGLVDGLKLGSGVQAVILTRGLREVSRLGGALGARAETFSGMSCMGVFLGACLSKKTRDYRLGLEIGAEALKGDIQARPQDELGLTAGAALQKAQALGVEMPLIGAVHGILREGIDPSQLKAALMSRPNRAEDV